MKVKIFAAIVVLSLSLACSAHAQSTVPITVGQVASQPAFYMHPNIYSLPLTIGGNSGTAWFYPQTCFSGACGFILFRPALEGTDYVTAMVTAWTATAYNALGQPTQALVAFTVVADPNEDGDSDTVVGSFTLNFTYTFVPGVGRGHGWRESIVGGSGQQTIAQD